MKPNLPEPIAIVGMAFRLPGGLKTDAGFWEALLEGRCYVGPLSQARRATWSASGAEPAPAGFLDDVAHFDASFFGMKGLEACYTDPAQRLLLEVVYWAFEHAGIDISTQRASQTGVFVGAHTSDYLEMAARANVPVNAYWNAGMNGSMLANRISYVFDFLGPSLSLNTACSSSLEALVTAVSALRQGRCSQAVVAGVNLILQPTVGLGAERAGMLSPDARCKTFDRGANGFVRGEGVTALILKPLSQAQAAGDLVLATILAAQSGHGGHAASVTAPNLKRQRDLILATYRESGIDPTTVSYLECHGTGTPMGDSVEAEALKEAFAALIQERAPAWDGQPYCLLGSVKTNLGHLESAAGLAGLIKVCLAMKHETRPGLVGFTCMNPLIDLAGSPFLASCESLSWPASGPRRAGISGFGFGGSMAHVVVERGPSQAPSPVLDANTPCVLLLSARDQDRLLVKASELAAWLDPSLNLADISWTCAVGRQALETRLAIIATSLDDARAKLHAFAAGTSVPGVYSGIAERRPRRRESEPLPLIATPCDWAQLWVAGRVEGSPPLAPQGQRIRLPLYPFAGKAYWLDLEPPT